MKYCNTQFLAEAIFEYLIATTFLRVPQDDRLWQTVLKN